MFLGGFCYFAYWMTRLVQEQQRQTDAPRRLDALRPDDPTPSRRQRPLRSPALVATAKGTMAHRQDCAVVAGKRASKVAEKDGLTPCNLCNPYDG